MKKNVIIAVIALVAVLAAVFLYQGKKSNLPNENLFNSKLEKVKYKEAIENKDYSQNVSGYWAWHATDLNNKTIIGMGALILKEDKNGKITGEVRSISPVRPVTSAANKDVAFASSSLPLIGHRIDKDKITFEVDGTEGLTSNKIILKNNGHNLSAKSAISQLINGRPVPAEYYWHAIRMSDD